MASNALLGSAIAVLYLHRLHRRTCELSPKYFVPTRALFGSKAFDDVQVLRQLASLEHQVLLAEHGSWPELERKGVCSVSLANHLLKAFPAGTIPRRSGLSETRAFLRAQTRVAGPTRALLLEETEAFLDGLREAAESYLSREVRAPPSWAVSAAASPSSGSAQASIRVASSSDPQSSYETGEFLAKGSAGLVYAARSTSSASEVFDLVLKRVYPTQRESALNEYRISERLRPEASARESTYCLIYTDKIVDPATGDVWLVMPRVWPNKEWGVDLREYLAKGFFQSGEGKGPVARELVRQLLLAAQHVSTRGVVIRDVKPDNVLVVYSPEHGRYEVRLTDFGLAVDLGAAPHDGSEGVRSCTMRDAVALETVQWWYDVSKLVPRPKWKARRPPERAVQRPSSLTPVSSFDVYMFGIILACVATGVDLPHIDDPAVLKQLLGRLSLASVPPTYLSSLVLGEFMAQNEPAFRRCFRETFVEEGFADELMRQTQRMLDPSPQRRPTPASVLEALKDL